MKQNTIILRPHLMPLVRLPLAARSVGHYFYQQHRRSFTKEVDFVQVLWGVNGTGVMRMDKIERRLGPKQVGLYFPGNTHQFYALDEPWEFYWWTMDGPLAAASTAALGLTPGQIYDSGPAPTALFQKLGQAMRTFTPESEYRASSLAYELLVQAAFGRVKTAASPLITKALEIIHKRWNDPQFGVEQIAEELQVNRSIFSRRFHTALGVAPVAYLIKLRVQNALNLLKGEHRDDSVDFDQVARACGWTSTDYFCRCIRKATGLSPQEFHVR